MQRKLLILDTLCSRRGVINKDVNGGLGTRTLVGSSFRAKAIETVKQRGVVLPLLELGYFAAFAKQQGYDVCYLQVTSKDNLKLLVEELGKQQYSHVVFYPALPSHKMDIEIADYIGKFQPHIVKGAIGPFVSVFAERVIGHFNWVISGEPEAVLSSNSIDNFKGIVNANEFVSDLNLLPFPNWKPFNVGRFSYRPMLSKVPFLSIQGTRGCPMPCFHYCPYPAFQGRKWRSRSSESLMGEIEYMQSEFGIRSILFRDPFFTFNRERAVLFAEDMLRKNLTIEWGCETRLDFVDIELLKLLRRAGLRSLNVGIESSDNEILKLNYRKGAKLITQEDLIKYAKSIGVKVNGFYILGLNGDTSQSIAKTVDYALRLNTFSAQFTINTPLPGTPFYAEMANKLLTDDLEKFDNNTLVFEHPNFTSAELKKWQEKAFLKFYYRPKFLLDQISWKYRDLVDSYSI